MQLYKDKSNCFYNFNFTTELLGTVFDSTKSFGVFSFDGKENKYIAVSRYGACWVKEMKYNQI